MNIRNLTFLFTILTLLSCKKNDPSCGSLQAATIMNNGPVTEGRTLDLETLTNESLTYRWYGPNGWKIEYQYYSSTANQQQRENITMADAGEYKVQLINTAGCMVYEGVTNIKVVAAPLPTCNIAANTSTSSDAGVGEYTFTYKSFQQSGSFFDVEGKELSAGGDAMHFDFLSTGSPLPDIYKTSGFSADTYNQVGLYINTGTYQFVAISGQDVYVNKVNNKLEITFCSVQFNNPLNPSTPIIISAKINSP